MAHKSTPSLLAAPRPSSNLLWPLRAIALLLVLQSLVIVMIAWYYFSQVNWQQVEIATVTNVGISDSIRQPLIDALVFGGAFLPVALLLLLSALAFALLRRAAWLLAMTCEGILLFASLLIYFESHFRLRQSNLLYLLMLLGVLLVLYLNSSDVRMAFDNRRQQAPEDWLDRLEFERAEGITYLPLLKELENPQVD